MIEEDDGVRNQVQIKASEFDGSLEVEVGLTCNEIGYEPFVSKKVKIMVSNIKLHHI